MRKSPKTGWTCDLPFRISLLFGLFGLSTSCSSTLDLTKPEVPTPVLVSVQPSSFVHRGEGKLAQKAPSLGALRKKDAAHTNSSGIRLWCQEVKAAIAPFHWQLEPCEKIQWQVGGNSVEGRPLVYADFGDLRSENTTLIFSTVHGDEITPLYLGIELAHWLQARQGQLLKTRVVVAPLVNPDGFLRQPKTRMNAHGVDLNRNFGTLDWKKSALQNWKKKFHSDPRRFPGDHPRSEPETLFQEELIRLVKPQKILSIHSPLNFLDYDGPSSLALSRFPRDYTQECDRLRKSLKAVSGGFYPGSLGNYAGRELGIPTLTLELPSADAKKAENYWNQFSRGIRAMIQFTVPSYASRQLEKQSGS